MTLLLPIGLLGLLSLVAWLIIYLIKPNYQQKFVSSTYVWKRSLQYRRKRLPTSRLRNVLLILFQILLLICCAFVLSMPATVEKQRTEEREVIVVIDSSASMQTKNSLGESRFLRAVDGARELCDQVFAEGGVVSVVLADETPRFLAESVSAADRVLAEMQLDELTEDKCSYGKSDLAAALTLCETVLADNPQAQITVFTDEQRYVSGGVTLVNVAEEEEWNAAILNADAQFTDGYYVFTVEVACYGASRAVELVLNVNGANATEEKPEGTSMLLSALVPCSDDAPVTVVFGNETAEGGGSGVQYVAIPPENRITSYSDVNVILREEDSLAIDNGFDLYGGTKETIRVLYYTTKPNTFFNAVLLGWRNAFADRWTVEVTEVKSGDPPTEGYDFYIYEHKMPGALPDTGVVLMVDPDVAGGSGLRLSVNPVDLNGRSMSLTEVTPHEILRHVNADAITVSAYDRITEYDPSYTVLMACDTSPVVLVQDNGATKIAVIAFSLHYSNLALTTAFPMLMYNIFDYFFPDIVSGNGFEVGASVAAKSISETMYIVYPDSDEPKAFATSAVFTADIPGTYTIYQDTYLGRRISEDVYVKIASEESNIKRVGDALPNPYAETEEPKYYGDLLAYLAAALAVLAVGEWWLHSRENR